jgi:hypothetical protein
MEDYGTDYAQKSAEPTGDFRKLEMTLDRLGQFTEALEKRLTPILSEEQDSTVQSPPTLAPVPMSHVGGRLAEMNLILSRCERILGRVTL